MRVLDLYKNNIYKYYQGCLITCILCSAHRRVSVRELDIAEAVPQREQKESVWSYCRLLHQTGISVQCTSLLFSLCLFYTPRL